MEQSRLPRATQDLEIMKRLGSAEPVPSAQATFCAQSLICCKQWILYFPCGHFYFLAPSLAGKLLLRPAETANSWSDQVGVRSIRNRTGTSEAFETKIGSELLPSLERARSEAVAAWTQRMTRDGFMLIHRGFQTI